jgi:hypothetical protein
MIWRLVLNCVNTYWNKWTVLQFSHKFLWCCLLVYLSMNFTVELQPVKFWFFLTLIKHLHILLHTLMTSKLQPYRLGHFFLNIHKLQQYHCSQIYIQIYGTKYHFLHLTFLNLLQHNFCSKDVVTCFYSINSFSTYTNQLIILSLNSTTVYKSTGHEVIRITWYK